MLQDPQAFIQQDFYNKLKEGKEDLLVLEENISIKVLSFNYTNMYWIEKKRGQVIRTKQFIHPKLPVLSIDFIYKY